MTATPATSQPIIVLVHGASAESASWNGGIRRLQDHGYTAIAAANPPRSLTGDAEFLSSLLATIDGPIILVGHSYGGSVISNSALGNDNVKAPVFVAAFAPEEGESIGELSGRYPGSTLGDTWPPSRWPTAAPTSHPPGRLPPAVRRQHTADQAVLDAATQRPLRDVALNEGAGPPALEVDPVLVRLPRARRQHPIGRPPFMAERAKAREVVEVPSASHAVPVSQPDTVADMILKAAKDTS